MTRWVPGRGESYEAAMERRIDELVETLTYAAECVAAQTFDLKSLGKGRKARLVNIVNGMLDVADDTGSFRRSVGKKSSDEVRDRFPDLGRVES